MKKIFSLALAAGMAFSIAGSAFAEIQVGDINPAVYVNDREIAFQDQKAVIDVAVGRTMVPLRGVFEAMGAEVIWNGEARTVTINSKDNLTRLVLEIDNPVMKVYNAVSLVKYDESEFELETAPVILNDRTLIPLRAISENMEADVEWDENSYTVSILSKEYKKYIAKKTEENKGEDDDYVYNLKDNIINLSISADKEEVNAGDNVSIDVNISNIESVADLSLKGLSATVYYDSSAFAFSNAVLVVNGEEATNTLGVSNGEFMSDSAKTAIIMTPSTDEEVKITESAIARFTFTSINGEEGEFSLSDRKTHLGYDTGVLLGKGSDNEMYEDYQKLYIDTTPIIVK